MAARRGAPYDSSMPKRFPALMVAAFLTQRTSAFRLLPLQVKWFQDGLFVIAAGTGNGVIVSAGN